ncbi:MAG TPA: hypothetical protein VNT75_25140 [Symbiobacteriaceae bacterium]|nr:hypothetical protein [Symbiobacteriaceae bacterium]
MTKRNVELDERAVAVDNRAGYLAFQVMLWLLLADLGLHGWRPEWTNWNGFPADVVIIMLAGGTVHTVYAARARAIGPKRVRSMAISLLVGVGVAAAVLLAVKSFLL